MMTVGALLQNFSFVLNFFNLNRNVKRDVKLFIVNSMPHGFLNFDMTGGIAACGELVKKSAKLI